MCFIKCVCLTLFIKLNVDHLYNCNMWISSYVAYWKNENGVELFAVRRSNGNDNFFQQHFSVNTSMHKLQTYSWSNVSFYGHLHFFCVHFIVYEETIKGALIAKNYKLEST